MCCGEHAVFIGCERQLRGQTYRDVAECIFPGFGGEGCRKCQATRRVTHIAHYEHGFRCPCFGEGAHIGCTHRRPLAAADGFAAVAQGDDLFILLHHWLVLVPPDGAAREREGEPVVSAHFLPVVEHGDSLHVSGHHKGSHGTLSSAEKIECSAVGAVYIVVREVSHHPVCRSGSGVFRVVQFVDARSRLTGSEDRFQLTVETKSERIIESCIEMVGTDHP